MSVSREDVEHARSVLAGRIHRTPTFTSASLGVSLKAELFQKTGSFKARGALNRIAALTPEERERGVVTWSAGNHAQAVAWAAGEEGVDCLVQMWVGVSPLKAEATRGYGATVDLSPPDAAAAYERALAVADEEGRVFVHPHSDPLVVAGHGTLALELLEDLTDLETVVVGVGGGGLLAGIVTALDGRARVIAVEPERAQAFSAGLAAGRSVRVETDTIADGLAPPFAGELPLELCRGRVEAVLVTEDEIADGMRFLYARAKLACEPAGAAAAGAVLAGKVEAARGMAVIVSGGNVDPQQAAAILERQ
ncbi:MAG: pyridoxal-phosphate dependent enzyme [Actinobacteria bacterium]|nr:MAG: pyridoxal-phosphate dependent enzyme [Actinomycetota bacterium]